MQKCMAFDGPPGIVSVVVQQPSGCCTTPRRSPVVCPGPGVPAQVVAPLARMFFGLMLSMEFCR
jgi:hypothetical protein